MRRSSPNSDTHAERLVLALRERILNGEFVPGERLTELGLVPLLNASRTPIRLALERLQHEGLLEGLSSGGFRLRSFRASDILDSIEIRGVLEGTAARFAAERLESPDALLPLKSLLRQAILDVPVTIETFARYLERNDGFHREMWQLAKSTSLVRALEAASKLPFAAPGALVFTDGDKVQSIAFIAGEHHRAIVEAIEFREGGRAEALAREHSRISRRNLQLALEKKDLIRGLRGAALIQN